MVKKYGNIVGWGKYVPKKVVTNADLEKVMDTNDEWIVQRTGIKERHIVSENEYTSTMSVAAARDALKMAGVRASDLDLIIVATTTPDYLCPPVSSQVQDMLGANGVGAFTLVAGCTGFVYALATAQQFIDSGSAKYVLVIGAEIISAYIDWEDRGTAILFGDGAAAVVLEATDKPAGVLSHVLGSDGSKAEELILPGGGTRYPPSQDALDKGMNHLRMNGREVFKFATRIIGKALKQAMADANITADDIDLFIPHQANKRIIDHAAQQIGLPEEKVFVNIHKYGNTSAASVPIALVEALESGRAKIGDTLAFVAFGAGLTWAAAIVKLAERDLPAKRSLWDLPVLRWFKKPAKNGQHKIAHEAVEEYEEEVEAN